MFQKLAFLCLFIFIQISFVISFQSIFKKKGKDMRLIYTNVIAIQCNRNTNVWFKKEIQLANYSTISGFINKEREEVKLKN